MAPGPGVTLQVARLLLVDMLAVVEVHAVDRVCSDPVLATEASVDAVPPTAMGVDGVVVAA